MRGGFKIFTYRQGGTNPSRHYVIDFAWGELTLDDTMVGVGGKAKLLFVMKRDRGDGIENYDF